MIVILVTMKTNAIVLLKVEMMSTMITATITIVTCDLDYDCDNDSDYQNINNNSIIFN